MKLAAFVVAAVAGMAGALLAYANQWAAPAARPCADTVTQLASCAAPVSPWWAVAAAALLAAGAVLVVARWCTAGRRRG